MRAASSQVQTNPLDRGAAPAPSHLPSLDGLRGLSIILVMLGHVSKTPNFGVVPSFLGDTAHFGVVVFFVISGFLITTLLMAEQAKRGRISLKLFYARRAIRIFPAFYLFLAAVAVMWQAGWFPLPPRDLWFAAFYWMNHLPERSWQLGHLWSLAMEEQFYLVWPFTFAALGLRRAAWAAVGLVVAAPLFRGLGALLLRGSGWEDAEFFVFMGDTMAAGCVLALWRSWLESQAWYLSLFNRWVAVAVLVMALAINRYQEYTIMNVAGASVMNLGIALLIHRSVYHWDDGMGRLLNWRPLAAVGLLSYSLYLWQQVFLNRFASAWYNVFPQNVALTVATALASYYLVEKPFQKLRKHLRP